MNTLSEKLEYQCDCIDITKCDVFQDAEDVVSIVEDSKQVSREEFLNLAEVPKSLTGLLEKNSSFGYQAGRKIAWMYDINKERHYFFA